MLSLDMTGQPCPIPVVQAKKALADPNTAGIDVQVDNVVAVQNLEKMAKGLGYTFASRQESEKLFCVTLGKTGDTPAPAKETEPIPHAAPHLAGGEGPVVLITADQMGTGSEELGKILIKGYIFSLTELDPAPSSVIFLNGGARLTTEGANTVPDLKALEDKGVEILTCGTCANFFELSDKVAVGGITDMMGISTRLAAAGRLITI